MINFPRFKDYPEDEIIGWFIMRAGIEAFKRRGKRKDKEEKIDPMSNTFNDAFNVLYREVNEIAGPSTPIFLFVPGEPFRTERIVMNIEWAAEVMRRKRMGE